MGFSDGEWEAGDGTRLHYRDYASATGGRTILCLPGLTRNARDFEDLAPLLTPFGRVLTVDFRGRGASGAAKEATSYAPPTYADDVTRLLDAQGIARVVAIGTSLGGLVAMLLGPERLAGLVLNDIGPEIEAAGLTRIRGHVGKGGAYPTWLHAARALGEANAEVYPRFGLEDWLRFAKRLMRLNRAGRVVFDYDAKIAEPFRQPGGEAVADLWPLFDALAEVPALFVRGGRSDILSEATLSEMSRRHPGARTCEIPEVGHAPTLDEPEAVAAITAFVASVSA